MGMQNGFYVAVMITLNLFVILIIRHYVHNYYLYITPSGVVLLGVRNQNGYYGAVMITIPVFGFIWDIDNTAV